jgi:hypothetical protein
MIMKPSHHALHRSVSFHSNGGQVSHEEPDSTDAESSADVVRCGTHDFDFLFGHWKICNRRLQRRLEGCTEWDEFEASSECRPILGGVANQEEFRSSHLPDFIGMALRLHDPETRLWSIYWADNQSVALQPPVVGCFNGSEGVFEGADEYAGRPILVRFIWSRVDTPTPRWEQAFSVDGGVNWETNWTMEFRKARGIHKTR